MWYWRCIVQFPRTCAHGTITRTIAMSKTDNPYGTTLVSPKAGFGCRFLHDPFPECYCMNITSANIQKILAYCATNYQSCQIYCRKTNACNILAQESQ